jgi:hypothetical protein
MLRLRVRDDGVGMDPNPLAQGRREYYAQRATAALIVTKRLPSVARGEAFPTCRRFTPRTRSKDGGLSSLPFMPEEAELFFRSFTMAAPRTSLYVGLQFR